MNIVFFDGACGLCDRFVRFLAARDSGDHLRFAPLGGETAARVLPSSEEAEDSVIFSTGGVTYRRSEAALRAVATVGGVWGAARTLLIVPRFARDAVYRVVARHRRRFFGRTCALPSSRLLAKLLP